MDSKSKIILKWMTFAFLTLVLTGGFSIALENVIKNEKVQLSTAFLLSILVTTLLFSRKARVRLRERFGEIFEQGRIRKLRRSYAKVGSSNSSNLSKEERIGLLVDGLGGIEFEFFCAEMLKRTGYSDVYVTKSSGDQGADILAEKDGIKYAIQCKRYSSNLGNTPVQEVHAARTMYGCQIGAVLTNQYFTAGAKELANTTGVLLWDRDWLLAKASDIIAFVN